ncbi:MAG: DNA or RNA helicases of superfamily II [uncultured Frankineae bacterium]|uniref:DNA or RNA helicases of superfamily II n=1 Tax=uncultured Frankineae bacterium TaxID=437475 RepID=A0A6J4LK48_9ACTN|nr:MAG: DNA or RNA helicases of superfamily II [uncultured Frankineae bacterium]
MTAPLAAAASPRRPLRAWQREALQAHRDARSTDFLVTATPGAGKTSFALALAAELLERREVTRVVVVVPTDHLRTQWAEAAEAAGITLDPTVRNDDRLRPDVLGYVTTYAQVAQRPAVHRSRTEHGRRTLVVLDEIHHAGDGLSWGEAVAEAFEPARRRLALTGTPFRTRADERIPFVRYESDGDGALASVADYTYGYRSALADGVVRPVVFAAYTGVSRWRNSAGEVVSASLTGESTASVEATAWRTALDPGGEWVPHVLAAMDERLTVLREAGMPDAAGLVLASDQSDARAYAALVKRVTGSTPALILSDDPRASRKISAFARGTDRFAVCVRMISEGVDVPRAACLAWMTSYRTPLFFAQAVGRVVRSRRPGESATVFLPAVRPLLALAAELEGERNHVLPPPAPGEELLDPLPPPERADDRPVDSWQALGAEAEFAHVLHGGRAVTADAAAGAPLTGEDADFVGLPGLLSAEQTAALLSRRDADHRRRASSTRVDEGGVDDAGSDRELAAAELDARSWRAAGDLRREINRLVGALAARTGAPHGVVHARVRTAVPGPPSAAAPVQVLADRRDWLLEQGLR